MLSNSWPTWFSGFPIQLLVPTTQFGNSLTDCCWQLLDLPCHLVNLHLSVPGPSFGSGARRPGPVVRTSQ